MEYGSGLCELCRRKVQTVYFKRQLHRLWTQDILEYGWTEGYVLVVPAKFWRGVYSLYHRCGLPVRRRLLGFICKCMYSMCHRNIQAGTRPCVDRCVREVWRRQVRADGRRDSMFILRCWQNHDAEREFRVYFVRRRVDVVSCQNGMCGLS